VRKLPRARTRLLAATVLAALTVGLSTASAASAFSESYGFYEVGNNGYVQSAGAHTFNFNLGSGSKSGQIACQLFNSKGVNNVSHGNGGCAVTSNGAFVWARVYNQTGGPETIGGEAET
jgi:hypothetical protein